MKRLRIAYAALRGWPIASRIVIGKDGAGLTWQPHMVVEDVEIHGGPIRAGVRVKVDHPPIKWPEEWPAGDS